LGQANKGGGVKPVNGIPTFLSSYLDWLRIWYLKAILG
jgi:hypothetical protein